MAPGESLGHYTLERYLGGGGMGEVWIARDTRAARRVALKLIRRHLAEEPMFRQRFLNEARTLGQLEHERIVPLYAVLDEQGELGLALRYIEGHSLEQRLGKGTPLPFATALRYATDMLAALGYAHAHGVVHRDLKPANILIDRDDRAFLADFGIAVSEVVERGTLTGQAIGTPRYMSPEQIRSSRDVTARSDIYSLGVVLFEMFCGRVPFGHDAGGDDYYRILHAHCSEPPPSLRSVNPSVPAEIDAIVLACLAKDPASRPATCADVSAALGLTAGSGPRPTPAAARPDPAVRPAQAGETVIGQVAVQPRRPVPRAAWLSAGALAIVVSVGYLVVSSQSAPNSSTKPPGPVVVGPTEKTGGPKGNDGAPTAGTVPPGPGNNTPRVNDPPGSSGGKEGGRGTPIPEPVRPSPAGPAAAARHFAAAEALFGAGRYCDGLIALKEAIRADPGNSVYEAKRPDYVQGCDEVKAR